MISHHLEDGYCKDMKTLRIKLKEIFGNNKGESLIESIVSVFVLALLVLTITSIIQVSLRMSNRAIENAETMQVDVFNPLLGDELADDNMFTIIFTNPIFTVDVEHTDELRVVNVEGIWAFSPLEDNTP